MNPLLSASIPSSQKSSLLDVGQSIPNLISIELPCFVKSIKSALDMLGGTEHVQRILSIDDGAPLECRIPGDNPLRPNLVSTFQTKRSVVLKIKRKKIIKNGKVTSSTITAFDIVGLVKKTIVFTNPADFQFLPSFISSAEYQSNEKRFPLEIVPRSISRIDYEKRSQFLAFLHVSKRSKRSTKKIISDYGSGSDQEVGDDIEGVPTKKDDNVGGDDEDQEKVNGRKRNPDAGHTQILKFGDQIPKSHPLGKYPPRWIAKRDKTGEVFRGIQFIDKLNILFEKIPVLKRSQIIDMLDLGPRQHLFKECLPYAAYTYSNGPFCNLWIRHGYDCTAHPSSRIYQALNCRFPPQYLIKLSESLADYIGREKTHRKMVDLDKMEVTDAPEEFAHRFIDKGAFARLPMSLFGYVCKHQISFQVHTLADKQLFIFVNQLPITNICTEQTGWFTEDAVVVFRNFIHEVMEQRVQMFLRSPLVFAPKVTPPTIARSEDQHLVEARLQVVLHDYEVFDALDDAWTAAQDTYPTTFPTIQTTSSTIVKVNEPSMIVMETNPTRCMFFWLKKYQMAALENSGLLEGMLLPPSGRKSGPNAIISGASGSNSSTGGGLPVATGVPSTSSSSSTTGPGWSSTKRKLNRYDDLDDKARDQSAIMSASYNSSAGTTITTTSASHSSSLGPLFTSTGASFANTLPSQSSGGNENIKKRNVHFAPNTASQQQPAQQAPLQFTVNQDILSRTTGFSFFGGDDDSDSEED